MSRLTSLRLLDTDVVSTLSRPNPDPRVAEWFACTEPGTLAVSWSTVFELQFGVELARRGGSPHADTFERDLLDILQDRRFRVLLPTVEAAGQRARMFATPELRGFFAAKPDARKPRLGENLTTVATAMSVGAVIVTRHTKYLMLIAGHFTLPGVLHPATGEWTIQPSPDFAAVPKSTGRTSECFARERRTHGIRRDGGAGSCEPATVRNRLNGRMAPTLTISATRRKEEAAHDGGLGAGSERPRDRHGPAERPAPAKTSDGEHSRSNAGPRTTRAASQPRKATS